MDDYIELTVKAKTGYSLKSITVSDADGKTVAFEAENYGEGYFAFVMPASDVTVTAEWKGDMSWSDL